MVLTKLPFTVLNKLSTYCYYCTISALKRHLSHHQFLPRRPMDPSQPFHQSRQSSYSTHVFDGTFRLLGFSREHDRPTRPNARCLQCRSGRHRYVGSGLLDILNALTSPNETDCRRQRPRDEPNMTRDGKALWEGATSEMDKARLLTSKVRIAASGCTRCQSPHAAYAYRRGHPSCCWSALGLNLCASHPFPVDQRSPQEGHTDYLVKETPAVPLATSR